MILGLIPKVFFDTMEQGLDLFVDGMGFTIRHQDAHIAGVTREAARAYIVPNPEYAAKDRPELCIETDDIHALHTDIAARRPDLLHPNVPQIVRRDWGPLEFALLDKTGVCVIYRQWT